MRSASRAFLLCLLLIPGHAAAADDAPFSVREISGPGRIVAAELADLDGDGRGDLVAIAFEGGPPSERRRLRVYYGGEGGTLPEHPSFEQPLPEGATFYDLADVDGRPGVELLLVARRGVVSISFAAREPTSRLLALPDVPSAAPLPDERGLERLHIVRPELGGARLLVPGLGESAVLGADGSGLGRLRTGGRANYFVPSRPGPMIAESELDLYFDVPRLDTADVNGDGRADVVAATRHELRVFLQRADGSFPAEPDRDLPLGLVSADEHIRNTASVRVHVGDANGDGRADLLVTHASGGLLGARTQSRLYWNRDGTWNLASPDQVFENEGGIVTDQWIDLDGDGRVEWLRAFVPVSVLELAEVLLQRAIDVDASILRAGADGRFDPQPWFRRKYSIGFSFETMRPRGFLPTLEADWNGDGFRDLLTSGEGRALEVYLGDPVRGYGERTARQTLDTAGRLGPGDLDGDGLPDWVIYDPRREGAPMRIGLNRGALPGTPAGMRAAEPDAPGEAP
jgi:hypothetical protein